jgi:hypothetical protein
MAAATAMSAADSHRRLQDQHVLEVERRQRFDDAANAAPEARIAPAAIDQHQDQRYAFNPQCELGGGQEDVSSASVDERTVLNQLIQEEFSVEEIEGFTAKLAQNFTDFYK